MQIVISQNMNIRQKTNVVHDRWPNKPNRVNISEMLLKDGVDDSDQQQENPAIRLVLGSPILTRIKDCQGIFDKKHPKKR